MKQWPMIGLLVIGSALLGATVLSEPIASAAQNIGATITGPLDGQGNVRVHEQGTANVNVTNSSLSVAAQPPVTGGGDSAAVDVGEARSFSEPRTATAVTVALFTDARGVGLHYQGRTVGLISAGASTDTVALPLTRPIKFDAITCGGQGGGFCIVNWLGAEP
jgi:hypothetical protein